MKRIFVSTTSFASYSNDPLLLLKENNIFFQLNKKSRKLSPDEVPLLVREFDGVIAGTEIYNKECLKKLPDLKVISRLGVGLDNIDMSQAKQQSILVLKTKTSPALAVAELTLGIIIDLLRQISRQNLNLKTGLWEKHMGELFSGKTLGIIGCGTIGRKLVEITKGINLKYLAHDKEKNSVFANEYGVNYVEYEELLQQSDIISIHLNLSNDTHHLINYKSLLMMKRNALLINTSRGEIIDEKSLIKALDEKLIQGAGIDVFQNEPYNGPLLKYDNVTLTPHVGAYAKEIRKKMELEAVQNLIQGLLK